MHDIATEYTTERNGQEEVLSCLFWFVPQIFSALCIHARPEFSQKYLLGPEAAKRTRRPRKPTHLKQVTRSHAYIKSSRFQSQPIIMYSDYVPRSPKMIQLKKRRSARQSKQADTHLPYTMGFDIGLMMPCFFRTRGLVPSWKLCLVVHSGPIGRRRDRSYCWRDSKG